MKNGQENFQGANWEEYSDFELKWLEFLLTRGLPAEDVKGLADSFGIIFDDPSTDQAQLGNALLNDIPKNELIPAIKDLGVKNNLPSLENAEIIYRELSKLSRPVLLYLSEKIVKKENLLTAIKRDELKESFPNEKLARIILEHIV